VGDKSIVISVGAILKQTKQVKVKQQGKLNRHIISESMWITFAKNYQNYSVPVKTTACQSGALFLR